HPLTLVHDIQATTAGRDDLRLTGRCGEDPRTAGAGVDRRSIRAADRTHVAVVTGEVEAGDLVALAGHRVDDAVFRSGRGLLTLLRVLVVAVGADPADLRHDGALEFERHRIHVGLELPVVPAEGVLHLAL